MLVGKINVELKELECRVHDKTKFIEYCDSLIPEDMRHVEALRNNQRYLCCLLLRSSTLIKWDQKKDLIESVLKEVSIVGYTNNLIEVDSLRGLVNKDRVEQYRKGLK